MNLLPKKNPTTVNIGENVAYIEKELASDNDLIRRSDAITAMAKAIGHIVYDAEAISCHVMDSIPVVEPKHGKWIPCEERTPKLGQKVLASTKKTVFTQVFKGYYEDPTRWNWEHNSIKKIEAWMPLPKPWKGADDEM